MLLIVFSFLLACSIVGQAIGIVQIIHLVFIELITMPGISLIAPEIGFQKIVFKTLALAPAFFVLTLAPEYYNSLKELGVAFYTGRGSLGAATLLQRELDKPFHPVYWGTQRVSQKPSLSMEQALFCYTDGLQIGPFSFHIESGQTVGIIGATGHGKTTLLHTVIWLCRAQGSSAVH